MAEQTIAVIIPCYNEAVTIGKVIDDFHRELPQAMIYVIRQQLVRQHLSHCCRARCHSAF